jgi:hypothetical protein
LDLGGAGVEKGSESLLEADSELVLESNRTDQFSSNR